MARENDRFTALNNYSIHDKDLRQQIGDDDDECDGDDDGDGDDDVDGDSDVDGGPLPGRGRCWRGQWRTHHGQQLAGCRRPGRSPCLQPLPILGELLGKMLL